MKKGLDKMLESFLLVLLLLSIISPLIARGLVEGPIWFLEILTIIVFIVSFVSCITLIIIYAKNSTPFDTIEFIGLSFLGFVSYLKLRRDNSR